MVDPKNGQKVISCAYISEDNFSKDHIDRAPDIILGFDRGYRISDESALGTLQPRDDHGQHGLVVGRPLRRSPRRCRPRSSPASRSRKPVPDMQDVAPTILKYFGIATPAQMTGKALI